MPQGRPSRYTNEIADEVCNRVALGESMRSVGRDPLMPVASCLWKWKRLFPYFEEQYLRAKQHAVDTIEDEIMDIADDGSNDYMERLNKKTGETELVVNHENILSQVRVVPSIAKAAAESDLSGVALKFFSESAKSPYGLPAL